MFLQATGEQPSVRVVNAVEASLSKYIQVRAILSKEIQSMLHQQSNNIHGGSVKSIKNNEEVCCVHTVLALCAETEANCSHPTEMSVFVLLFSANNHIARLVISDCYHRVYESVHVIHAIFVTPLKNQPLLC